MERHAFAMKVKDGQMNTYRRKLGEIWPELTGFLDRNQIKNFSIWNAEDLIFGYYENEDGAKLSAEEVSVKEVALMTGYDSLNNFYKNFKISKEYYELYANLNKEKLFELVKCIEENCSKLKSKK